VLGKKGVGLREKEELEGERCPQSKSKSSMVHVMKARKSSIEEKWNCHRLRMNHKTAPRVSVRRVRGGQSIKW